MNPAIMNASGPKCGSLDELKKLAKSDAGAIVTKSISLEPRKGNEIPRAHYDEIGSLNSLGIPNLGIEQVAKDISAIKKETSKPIVANIAGFSVDDFKKLALAVNSSEADMIEANLSCPNIIGHPQTAYDTKSTKELAEFFKDNVSLPLSIKLPVYLSQHQKNEVLELIVKNKVKMVTLINTVGDSLMINPKMEMAVMKPKKGVGGLGGRYIKPIALGAVWTFYNYFKENKYDCKIIGVGGIYNGTDAFEFFLAGANAVQIGSAYYRTDETIFTNVKNELDKILEKKGYKSLQKITGKLKTF